MMTLDQHPEVGRYLEELVRRLEVATGDGFVGAYAGGSYALGAYRPGRSDLDVAAVVESALPQAEKETIVELVRHESLRCPARGLELVVYRLEVARSGTTEPGFELNLNTGAGMSFRVDLEPDPREAHWYAIDRAILHERGIALAGPAARGVFGPIPQALLLPIVAESLRWHLDGEARPEDVVLNACRALRYGVEGSWSSKPEAGEWAMRRGRGAEVVDAALAAREGGGSVEEDAARAFVRGVLDEIG